MAKPGHSVITNIDRLNAHMDKEGLAAVAVRSGVNFTYLSGMAMPGTLARHMDIATTVRGFMVLWFRHGEPIIVLDAFAEKLARRESWIERVEVYEAYVGSLYSRVAELIEEAGLARARIGFEQDGLSALHWEHIRQKLPGLIMVNCSPLMDQVRWIKTPGEVVQQKQAADLLDEVLADIFPTIRTGETEREVHARMIAAFMKKGAAFVHGILNSSSNDVMYGGESGIAFRKGDFVRNDYVAYFKGCPGHQSRLAILGPPSDQQLRDYDMTLEIHRRTIERCRPGVSAGEIYQFVVREFARRSIDYTASLVGHGMGPWFHQQEPVLRSGSKTVLEKGMILAIEPQRLHWHLQDIILIEDGPPKLLSDKFPIDRPFVIGG